MRRTKTGRQPRGVLLVPVFTDTASGEAEDTGVEDAGVEDTVAEPALEEGDVASKRTDDQPIEDAAPAVTDLPPEPPPPAAPKVAAGAGDRMRRLGRPAAFVALLVVLAFAGVLVGRLLRGSDDGATALPTAIETTTARTTPTTRPRPIFETWGPFRATPSGTLARPAARAAATVAGGRVVVLGGSSGNAVLVGAPGGTLRPVGDLPSRLAAGAAFVHDGAVYLVGGEDATATPSDGIVRIDLASRKVTSAGRFVEPLAGAGYVQTGDSLVLVGGWTGEKYATAVLRFTLPDTADVVARLPEATRDTAVTVRGDTLYVAGGRTESGLSTAVYAVDLGAGTVSVIGRLPHGVAGGALVPAGGKLYLIGGKDAAGPVRTIVSIDPATGTVENAGTMPRALAGAAVIRAGGATYLLGGTRPTAVMRLEVK
jgi:hypothetical protein